MKKLDVAIIRDMAEEIFRLTMLAVMAGLCIVFIKANMAAVVWFFAITFTPMFHTYARKRITNRTTHERKLALFTKNPNSRAGLFGTK
ncbi:hypothetical protein ABDD95_19465 [Mucilaginibacter sp. PAMB04274]|uniref:hypothetical protein n=1 Tax=Mucilaginibacter sp. PAMB04274 TaxID=3138568 RepID=UPI0031F6B58B